MAAVDANGLYFFAAGFVLFSSGFCSALYFSFFFAAGFAAFAADFVLELIPSPSPHFFYHFTLFAQ